MPENFKKMKNDYNMDVSFVEERINYKEFIKHHSTGTKDDWGEIRYVALQPFFLRELLLKLSVERRLRAVLRLKNYTIDGLKKTFDFGGSVYDFFDIKNESTIDKLYTDRVARLSIILDIPIVYLLKNQPSAFEVKEIDFLEYFFLGKKKEFNELNDLITRPKKSSISPYVIENKYKGNEIFIRNKNNIKTRVVLEKTYFAIEFFIDSKLEFDIQKIKVIIKCFDNRVIKVMLSTPTLRESFKLSFIGTYIKEQQVEANKYADELVRYYEGQQVYPPVFQINPIPN